MIPPYNQCYYSGYNNASYSYWNQMQYFNNFNWGYNTANPYIEKLKLRQYHQSTLNQQPHSDEALTHKTSEELVQEKYYPLEDALDLIEDLLTEDDHSRQPQSSQPSNLRNVRKVRKDFSILDQHYSTSETNRDYVKSIYSNFHRHCFRTYCCNKNSKLQCCRKRWYCSKVCMVNF